MESLHSNASQRGLCQIIGFFQKLFAIQSIDYSEEKFLERRFLVATMKRLVNNRNYYLRNAVMQSLSQLGFEESHLCKEIKTKPALELRTWKHQIRSFKKPEGIFAVTTDTAFKTEQFERLNDPKDQLKLVCKAAGSNSVFERRKCANFIALKEDLNPKVKLMGLIVSANDEIDTVGYCFKEAGKIIKPWALLIVSLDYIT